MNISLDEFLFTATVKTGIGWNQEYLTNELTSREDVTAIMNAYHHPFKKHARKKLSEYKKRGVKVREALLAPHYGLAYYALRANFPYKFFFRPQSDVTLFFNYFVPKNVGTKTAVYVCDVNYKVFPETTRPDVYNWLDKNLPKYCERADMVITISEFSKSEIIKYLQVPEEKIQVVPCGYDPTIYHTDFLQRDLEDVRHKYDIPKEYILYLGTLEPRKNIPILIEAYAKLMEEYRDYLKEIKAATAMGKAFNQDSVDPEAGNIGALPKLVLAGMKGWSYDEIFARVKELGIEDRVIFTGYVSAEDAPKLMAGAKFFVFPSKYEGFGMPPLEAMACGTPVIVSDAASLPEVVGDAGLYCKSGDVNSLVAAMKQYLGSEEVLEEYTTKALKRAQLFTWDKVADILLEKLACVFK